MSNTLKGTLIVVLIIASMMVGYVGGYSQGIITGKQVGAKIGLSDTGYRLNEVRQGCENIFAPAECDKCHASD